MFSYEQEIIESCKAHREVGRQEGFWLGAVAGAIVTALAVAIIELATK